MKKVFIYFLGFITGILTVAVAEAEKLPDTENTNNVEMLAATETTSETEMGVGVENVEVESEDVQQEQTTKVRSYSGTCAGTTKKGTRCRRKPSKGSIYCWQHK